MTSNPQKELAITICSNKSALGGDKSAYEHQIMTNFDVLNEIRHTQLFSETVNQSLSRQAKYNQGFGYAKQAVGLSLELGCENELNEILQTWISEKKRAICNRQPRCTIMSNKENLKC
jgi:hypothetical protein